MYNQQRDLFPSELERFHAGRVALNLEAPDLIVRGGEYINVFTRRIERGDIWVSGRLIAKVTTETCQFSAAEIDVTGKLVSPGFVEGHIHVESSLCDPIHFAKAALRCGVTSVFTDFHEVGAIAGKSGILEMIAALRTTPVKGLLMTPIELPFLPEIQQTVSSLVPAEALSLLAQAGTVGLAEVNGRKITEWLKDGRPSDYTVIADAITARKTPEGHLFFTRGNDLNACLAVGISSDHEPRKRDEVVEKISKGLFVMLRNGTLAREVETLVGVVPEQDLPTERIGLVTDDMMVSHMTPDTYMLHKIRTAVNSGVSPIEAIRMVTLNLAEHYRVGEIIGSLRAGAYADMVVIDSLDSLAIQNVIANGTLMDSSFLDRDEKPDYNPTLLHTFTRSRLGDVEMQWLPPDRFNQKEVTIRAIELDQTTRFTELVDITVPVHSGEVELDVETDDVSFLLCANRKYDHLVGLGFLRGYGLGAAAAVAVSLAHDHHGIVALGRDKASVRVAANRVIELQGGIVLVEDGTVSQEIALPLAGVMAIGPSQKVSADIQDLEARLRQRGVTWREPLFFLFWLGMEVAPHFRISDHGVFDTESEHIVSPFL